MSWTNLIGYLAAVLMFSTFYMKRMIPLRAVGASANVVFVVFAAITHVYPLLVLHAVLFPLNITRMIQMIKLVKKVKAASTGDFSMDFLVPFMTKEEFKKGDVIFKKGDESNKMYYLRKGLVRVDEVNSYITDGQLIGEIGVFSRYKKRTATVVCEADTQFYTIPESTVLQLYYQNPKFGFYLMQLVIQRFMKNIEELDRARNAAAAEADNNAQKRRTERLNLKLPVEINGVDHFGNRFTEETSVENLSTDGAYLLLRNTVGIDSKISLLIDKANSGMKITAKVTRLAKEADGTGVGVFFLKDAGQDGF